MINPAIPPLLDDMAVRLEVAYGVAPSSLQHQQAAIGRNLPAKYRPALSVLVGAEQAMSMPKVARQMDLARVQKAHAQLVPFLKKQNLDEARKDKVIGVVTTIAVNLLIVMILVLAVLLSRGFL